VVDPLFRSGAYRFCWDNADARLMPSILYRCPTTGNNVQAWFDEDVPADDSLTYCRIWYSISRTVSDDGRASRRHNGRSVRAFAVKPRACGAPQKRRWGLTAWRGRAIPVTVPPMPHDDALVNHRTRSDNVRQVECWFSQIMYTHHARPARHTQLR
jgi:hypothetical protein